MPQHEFELAFSELQVSLDFHVLFGRRAVRASRRRSLMSIDQAVADREPPQEPPRHSVVIGLVVAAAFFMQGLDGAIMNTSLPQMAATLRVHAVDMNAGITAYILALAIFTPLSGWMADRFGARTVFASAVLIFTVASVGCGAATSLSQFIVARVVQGIGGALMTPVGRLVILRSARPHELLRLTAIIVWPALFAPVVGPVIGGAITTYFGWRWNFLLNLPLGLAGVGLVLAVIPNFRETNRKPLDLVGAAISGASLFLLIYGLTRLASDGLALQPMSLFLLGALLGAGAVLWFRRRASPLLDLAPIRIPTFAVTSIDAGNLFMITMAATPFLLPLMLQSVWGYDSLQAGWWLLVYFLGNLATKVITTPVLRWLGFRRVMLLTGLAIAVTVTACGFLDKTTAPLIVGIVLFAAGGTRSMQGTAVSTLAFADVTADKRASAATLSSMMQQLAFAVGIALAALALNLSRSARGDPALAQSDFRIAFAALGVMSLIATALCLRLRRDAGAEVSGHRRTLEPLGNEVS